MSDVTEQIKERINVAELLGEYLRLEKAGSNYKALCPFHNEKTPSFMVNPERNFWYCFGCQKGGDIFTFIQEMEGIEFRESLERLAERAGVELPKISPAYKERKSQRQKITEIIELATKVYEYYLLKHKQTKDIREYLQKRGMGEEVIKKFRLGYAPNAWSFILEYLKNKGYQVKDILETGLLVEKEGKSKYYDRFRDRIMFPIIDITGKVVGYSARIAPGGDEHNAKYINTPQTTIYDKSRVLYGLYQSRAEVRKKGEVIVVEGNADVILSHQAGVENVVAISGTALTAEQVKVLKRYAGEVKLCLDMDEAGQKATEKSIEVCLSLGMNVEIITLPRNIKDVGELVEKKAEEWREVAQKSQPVMEYYFAKIFKKYNVENIKERKEIASQLLNIISHIGDPIEKNYWIKKLAIKIAVEEDVLTDVLEKIKLNSETKGNLSEKSENDFPTQQDKQPEKEQRKTRKDILEEQLLGLFILFPNELKAKIADFKTEILSQPSKIIWQSIKENNQEKDENKLNQLAVKVKYSYDDKSGLSENKINPLEEWELTVNELKKEVKVEKAKKITLDIKRAEEAGDEEAAEILLAELKKLKK